MTEEKKKIDKQTADQFDKIFSRRKPCPDCGEVCDHLGNCQCGYCEPRVA